MIAVMIAVQAELVSRRAAALEKVVAPAAGAMSAAPAGR